jgi:hypothetical protein
VFASPKEASFRLPARKNPFAVKLPHFP